MTGGLFAILDDIALLLDDAAAISKVAARKTAGLLGDDLAVNAEKATGFRASRELPVLWAITKGSFVNKLIILPLAFLLSAYLPWLIVPILIAGGTYLSYEGVEKIHHVLCCRSSQPHEEPVSEPLNQQESEKLKIRSAIRTDFILSIEIVVITLGTVIGHPPALQLLVVSLIAALATIGVYGLVALIVRMDDVGFFLIRLAHRSTGVVRQVTAASGRLLVTSLPVVIRLLGVVGTVAMILVGGGMFTHNIDRLHHLLGSLPSPAADFMTGLVVGTILLAIRQLITRFR
ncbi:DUF808 domain-containing protein [Desulforhopalus singaporensis]|uniref:Inner membrane protein YedI n=1 Tax=Desulforhopalus singaporensis TaxID=91360 RepID=A0A1H0LAD5_9BACT|nr:DUF808 domain-containing protein [Desulforhopalus singaporensis]SDO65204.1 hypothetical protein SAMN05660330_00726 [Desulforhopalus singaporensis]